MGETQLLEEYDANLLDWATRTLARAQASRAAEITRRVGMGAAGVASAGHRAALARLRRNETIYDTIWRIKLVAPEIDGNARRGQYLRYIHGGSDSPGWGRHYASGSYIDGQHKRRSPDLQGCPRELRRLLAGLHCHDLDFGGPGEAETPFG